MNHHTKHTPDLLPEKLDSDGAVACSTTELLNELRLESLLRISQYPAKTIQDLVDYATEESIALTGSKIGYVFYYDERTQFLTLNSWSKTAMKECAILDKQTIYKLSETGFWGEPIRQRKPIIVNNFDAPNPLKKGHPVGHVAVHTYLTIPVFIDDKITAVVGVANKEGEYDQADVRQLTLLWNSVWTIVDRKRAETEMREKDRRLQLFAENIGDVIWTMALSGRFLYVSPSIEQMTGYRAEEFVVMPFDRYMTPDAEKTVTESIREALDVAESGRPIEAKIVEWEFRHKNGNPIHIEASYNGMYNETGQLICFQGVARDITQRKSDEERLRKSERRHSLFAENANAILWELDLNGRFTYISPSVAKLLGYSAKEVINYEPSRTMTNASAVIVNQTLQNALDAMQRNLPTPEGVIEVEHFHKNGSKIWTEVHYSGMFDESGKAIGIQGITFDITQRKQAEENRMQMRFQEKCQIITDMAIDLLGIDSCSIWMIKPGDACDSGCFHADAADPRHSCKNREKCFHLISTSGENNLIGEQGRRVPLNCPAVGWIVSESSIEDSTIRIVGLPQGNEGIKACCLGLPLLGCTLLNMRREAIGVFAVSHNREFSPEENALLDNFAKKTTKIIIDHETEEELWQAQKLEGVGQLAGGVAHEFNNLLQVIEGYTRYAMEGLDPQETRYNDLEQVLDAADRAATLTRQLLGFSRRKAVQLESVDANQVVQDLIKLIRPTIGKLISVNYSLGNDVGMVHADAVDLQQALLNLCLNARDAMPAGGLLTIKTAKTVLDQPIHDTHFDIPIGKYVVFSVSDTGCGISREVQQKMFEPFFTTKEVGKGTGLGLSMVYGMVRQHKGAILIESEVDRGTEIELLLPIAEAAQTEENAEIPVFEPQPKETILIAEDDPTTQFFLTHILKDAGYPILVASDGEEALRLFEDNCKRIDMVVLDFNMPIRNGLEVYHCLQDAECNAKFMFCTGIDGETVQFEKLEQEGIPAIRKPFNAQYLLAKVREVLDSPDLCHLKA
jgi:PAS domain S-box-containing protein